jgi:putative transposase
VVLTSQVIMVIVKLKRFKRAQFTHLTNSQWKDIKKLLDTGRKRRHSLRKVLNAVLKITRTGTQWRNLEKAYPAWQVVYYYFRKWQRDGTFALILRWLVEQERQRQGRLPQASASAVDSQSVKKGSLVSLDTGIDGNKFVNGRKRHLAVDSLGLPLAIYVGAANVYDGEAGKELLWQLDKVSSRLKLIRADHAYQGDFVECADYYTWKVEITQKPESQQGFIPQTGRWQVERSFAWFNFFRRLSKDYEKTVESSVAFIQMAFIDIILARLPK